MLGQRSIEMTLDDLEPLEVFHYFERISTIPHGSGNTKAISDYCVAFAKEHGLRCFQDELNNVIIYKPATKGYEQFQTIILQGHLDMVCIKGCDCKKDLVKEGLDLFIEGDYIGANGTSLGGDDGIAIAICLAILSSNDIVHPNLEVVFTVDEETGMNGAKGLDVSRIVGRKMINLDSEEEGVFTVACAGGTKVTNAFEYSKQEFDCVPIDISILGLSGGHSGTEIHKGKDNAIVLMSRLIFELLQFRSLRLFSISGGVADNAIANNCSVRIGISQEEQESFLACLGKKKETLFDLILSKEPAFQINISVFPKQLLLCITREDTERIVRALTAFPNGVIRMSQNSPSLPETSLNFGIIETLGHSITMTFSVRSSVRAEKESLVRTLSCITKHNNGTTVITGDYPPWEYLADSILRTRMTKTYTRLFNIEPTIIEIHAGLECGILAEKIPGLDCVSIGPNILNIHTIKERISIESVKRTWAFLLEILKQRELEA